MESILEGVSYNLLVPNVIYPRHAFGHLYIYSFSQYFSSPILLMQVNCH